MRAELEHKLASPLVSISLHHKMETEKLSQLA
jgi:hypothetical protein